MKPELWLLVVSLLINLAGLAAIIRVVRGRGGMRYLKSIVLKDNEATVDLGSRARREMYASLPAPLSRPIVFLGDSITVACEWHEVYGGTRPILNRAIGGDTSLGVLERVGDVCRLNPMAVFLMIGTNDPQMLLYSPAETLANVRSIVAAILDASPDAHIYIQSVLPSRVPKFNVWSQTLNTDLRTLCDGRQLSYVDLRPEFTDADQLLDAAFTYDGLHLSAEGYLVWRRRIQGLVDELTGTRIAAVASVG